MNAAMISPTLKLISQQCNGGVMHDTEPKSEISALRDENEALRRKLAHLTAQYIWTEGGSYAKINEEIRQYGFRLERMTNSYDPRIVPITKVKVDAVVTETPIPVKLIIEHEKKCGKSDPSWGRA